MFRYFRKILAHYIFQWADQRYGVKARGPVRGFRLLHDPVLGQHGISDFTTQQKKMLKKWHYWMSVKNRIYRI